MNTHGLLLAGIMAISSLPSIALAEVRGHSGAAGRSGGPDEETPEAAGTTRTWYGWQTLTVDGIALVAVPLTALATEDLGLLGVAMAGYALGPPTVHFAHRNVGAGFGSLGLRVGAPVLGAVVGYRVTESDCRWCGLAGGAAGLAIGMATAIAIDAAVLAYDEQRSPAAARGNSADNRYQPIFVLSGSF